MLIKYYLITENKGLLTFLFKIIKKYTHPKYMYVFFVVDVTSVIIFRSEYLIYLELEFIPYCQADFIIFREHGLSDITKNSITNITPRQERFQMMFKIK